MNDDVDKLFDILFNEVLDDNLDIQRSSRIKIENEIKDIDNEMDNITHKLITLNNQTVLNKLEEKLEELENEKLKLKSKLETEEDGFNKE